MSISKINNSENNFDKIYIKRIAEEDNYTSINKLVSQRTSSNKKLDDNDLSLIKDNLYNLMKYRCRGVPDCTNWLEANEASIPEITNELLDKNKPEWFPIPGMYGGFAYSLIEQDNEVVLIADSWVRIVGGSGQQHKIKPNEVELISEGFV